MSLLAWVINMSISQTIQVEFFGWKVYELYKNNRYVFGLMDGHDNCNYEKFLGLT